MDYRILFSQVVYVLVCILFSPNTIDYATCSYIPCEKGAVAIKDPGFTAVFKNTSTNSSYYLLVSSFSGIPFSKDAVYYSRDVGRMLEEGNVKLDVLNGELTWPNELATVPGIIFNNSHNLIAVPDGFLVPTKGRGSVSVFDLDDQKHTRLDITSQPGERDTWFYHRAMFFDMDADGSLDLLTCRANVNLLGKHKGQLVWFSPQPDRSQPWQPHVIAEGPDVNFVPIALHSNNLTYGGILCAEFFSKQLVLYWLDDSSKDWSNTAKVKRRVISDSLGPAFDLSVADVNGDGRPDILVTSNSLNGSLLVYLVPVDFTTQQFDNVTIAHGFKPDAKGPGKGAPGTATLVIPSPNYSLRKPLIVLSGDDDGKAYILTPASDDPNDWNYTSSTFFSPGGTVGGISVADVNGDHYQELFVPAYSKNQLHIFSFDCVE